VKRAWLVTAAVVAAIVLVLGTGLWLGSEALRRQFAGPDPETIAQASLAGLREQNRLTSFTARYVAVVTSKQSRLGLSAEKTLIMPGMVRYEVDLSKLQQRDVQWDAEAKRMTITLPPLEVVGPQIELDNIREYSNGGLLMRLTRVEGQLDAANRKAGQQELLRQAKGSTPVKLAREATRRAVERSFAMPLKAVGLDASVRVLFPDERGGAREVWDMSRNPADVVANKW
jgi:hypothetical protein